MITILDPAKVYVLWYNDPDEDPCICEIYASREKAIAEARRRNKEYCMGDDEDAFTAEGDFKSNEYDSCDYAYYEVVAYALNI